MTPAVALALETTLGAQASSRIEAPKHTPVDTVIANLRSELAPHYQEIWDANNRRERHRKGRREGKSHYLVRRKIAKTLVAREDVINPYILPTLKSVSMAIWPLAKVIVRRHFGKDAVVHETLRMIKLPVGGSMVFGGCETKADCGNWFGMVFNEATIDEAGNYPDGVLCQLYDESIEPALMDFGGDFILGGNPGLVLQGRWYGWTKQPGIADDGIPVYTGDARNNPFLAIGDVEAYYAQLLKDKGWTKDNATFRRQYLGEWVEDAEGLVFPFTHENMLAALPTHSRLGGSLPANGWRYVIGVDVGYVDSTAIAVLAAHPLDNREIVVRAEKWPNWIPDQLAYRLKELLKQYPGAPIVMDTGGMGKVHAEELRRKFGLGIIPAEKRDKASAVRIMRDDIRSKRMCAIPEDCEPFLAECSVIGWDEDKRNPVEGLPDDCTHAVYYAHRWQHHYGDRSAEPVDDSPAARAKRQEDEWIAARMKAASRTNSVDRTRAAYARR